MDAFDWSWNVLIQLIVSTGDLYNLINKYKCPPNFNHINNVLLSHNKKFKEVSPKLKQSPRWPLPEMVRNAYKIWKKKQGVLGKKKCKHARPPSSSQTLELVFHESWSCIKILNRLRGPLLHPRLCDWPSRSHLTFYGNYYWTTTSFIFPSKGNEVCYEQNQMIIKLKHMYTAI